jgi:hypothetical protein
MGLRNLHGSPQASLDGVNHVEKLDWLLVSYVAQTDRSLCPPAPAPSRHEAEEPKDRQFPPRYPRRSKVPPQVTKVMQLDRAPARIALWSQFLVSGTAITALRGSIRQAKRNRRQSAQGFVAR